MNKPTPDPRIAAYVDELSGPVPYVSYSHNTLVDLNRAHGSDVVRALLDAYFRALREYDRTKNAAL